jgi:hypothetical protein
MSDVGSPDYMELVEDEEQKWENVTRQAIEPCAVLSCIRDPVNFSLINATKKLHRLRAAMTQRAKSPPHSDNTEATLNSARTIADMARDMGDLRCDIMQARDLLYAMLLICDRFLEDTHGITRDMIKTSHKLRERGLSGDNGMFT